MMKRMNNEASHLLFMPTQFLFCMSQRTEEMVETY